MPPFCSTPVMTRFFTFLFHGHAFKRFSILGGAFPAPASIRTIHCFSLFSSPELDGLVEVSCLFGLVTPAKPSRYRTAPFGRTPPPSRLLGGLAPFALLQLIDSLCCCMPHRGSSLFPSFTLLTFESSARLPPPAVPLYLIVYSGISHTCFSTSVGPIGVSSFAFLHRLVGFCEDLLILLLGRGQPRLPFFERPVIYFWVLAREVPLPKPPLYDSRARFPVAKCLGCFLSFPLFCLVPLTRASGHARPPPPPPDSPRHQFLACSVLLVLRWACSTPSPVSSHYPSLFSLHRRPPGRAPRADWRTLSVCLSEYHPRPPGMSFPDWDTRA